MIMWFKTVKRYTREKSRSFLLHGIEVDLADKQISKTVLTVASKLIMFFLQNKSVFKNC